MRKPELLLLPLIPALGFAIVELASHITVPGPTVTMAPIVTTTAVTIAPEVAPPAPPPPCIECTAVF